MGGRAKGEGRGGGPLELLWVSTSPVPYRAREREREVRWGSGDVRRGGRANRQAGHARGMVLDDEGISTSEWNVRTEGGQA